MKHQTIDALQAVAEVRPKLPDQLSQREKLEIWAQLLEAEPGRRLSTLHQTEYCAPEDRDLMRAEGSPLSVAFASETLRAAGLRNDTYGEAKRFFALSDAQLHDVICYCHFGSSVNASTSAARVRRIASGNRPSLLSRLREIYLG